jgi:glycosyltransferase involved in cell wall biosynthesis
MASKILVFCPDFLPNQTGYSHAFALLVQNLLQHGCYVDVLTPCLKPDNEPEILQHPKLNIVRYQPQLKIWALGLFYRSGKLAGRIDAMDKQQQYDLVFIETGDDPLLIASLPQRVLNKTVVRFHSTSDTEYLFIGKHKKYKLRRLFWHLLACYNVKYLSATNAFHLGFAHQKVLRNNKIRHHEVIINYVPEIPDMQVKVNTQRKFFMLGRMDEEGYRQKGFDLLLTALLVLEGPFKKHHAKLTIVGSGKHYETFSSVCKQYDFVEVVPYLHHHEVMQELQSSDVVLLPSLFEGLSMFALEALANANAVVFSNTGGLKDLVHENGILIEPGNALALANAIKEMLTMSDAELLLMKQNSLKWIQQHFNADVQWQQIKSIYQQVHRYGASR